MKFKAAVFDMDGLMFNSEDIYFEAGRQMLAKRGLVYTKYLAEQIMGTTAQASMEYLIRELNIKESWESLAADSHRFFLELLPKMLKPMPGLLPLLDFLEANQIPRAIGTSSPRPLMEQTLAVYQLEPRFTKTVTGSDVAHSKPHPEIYLKTAAALAIEPSEMIVLEDSSTGCKAAKAAGAFTVAVPAEHSRNQNFSFVDLIADTLADPRIQDLFV